MFADYLPHASLCSGVYGRSNKSNRDREAHVAHTEE